MKQALIVTVAILLCGLFFWRCNHTAENSESQRDSALSERDPLIRQFNDSVKEHPADARLYYRRGQLFSQDTDYINAISDFSKAIQLDENNLKYRFAKADVLIQTTKINDAKKELQQIMALDSMNLEALTKLAKLNYYAGNYTEVMPETNRLVRINSKNYEPYFIRAMTYKNTGDADKAIADFKESVALNPGLYEGYMQLGFLYKAKDPARAERYFDSAIKTDSTNVNPWLAKAALYEQLHADASAKKVYQSLIAKSVFNAEAFIRMGKIYLKEDSSQKAFESFNYAVKVSPANYHAFYFRGVAAERMGEKGQASDDYASALNLKPDFDSAKSAMHSVQR